MRSANAPSLYGLGPAPMSLWAHVPIVDKVGHLGQGICEPVSSINELPDIN